MDKDKLNEAAEKAATIQYRNLSDPNVSQDGRTEAMFASMFEQGAIWLMQQPLSDRLTDEEKERIIKRYKYESDMMDRQTLKIQKSTNPTCRQFYVDIRENHRSRLRLLKSIFGEELFNEK